MKRPHVRHVHARPDEHVRVHRDQHRVPPPVRGSGLVGWAGGLLAALGPLGALVAAGVALWLVVHFVMGLLVVVLWVSAISLVARFAFKILGDR